MDGLYLLFPSSKDSLRGRHLHLSSLVGSRNHVSVDEVGPVSPEPELSAPREIAEELNEVEEEGGKLEDEDIQREKGGEGRGAEQAQDEEADERGSKGEGAIESDEVEEECSEGNDEGDGVSENMNGREENDSDEKVESSVERQQYETNDIMESDEAAESLVEEKEEVREDEEKHEKSRDRSEESSFKSDRNEGSNEDEEREELERSMEDKEAQSESEEDKVKSREDREEEGGESDEALERCSLSRRRLTQSDGEMIERCVQSEGGETEGEGLELDEESDGPRSQTASDSEGEIVEVFQTGTTTVRPAKLGGKTTPSDFKTLDQKRKTVACKMKNVTKKCPLPAEVGFGVASVRAASHPSSPAFIA